MAVVVRSLPKASINEEANKILQYCTKCIGIIRSTLGSMESHLEHANKMVYVKYN